MGYTSRGSITDFWPDDTDDKFYVSYGLTINSIIDFAKAKWPDVDLCDIMIESDNIHTSCLSYDRHCSGDYTNFIVVTNTNMKENNA